jgi:hypothetical protein
MVIGCRLISKYTVTRLVNDMLPTAVQKIQCILKMVFLCCIRHELIKLARKKFYILIAGQKIAGLFLF